MNLVNKLKIGIIVVLLLFYSLILFLIYHPRVSEDYKRYYITHETDTWKPNFYPANLAEGIHLARTGLPDFIQWTQGFAEADTVGRWTDARFNRIAAIMFKPIFQGKVCIKLNMGSAQTQVNKPVIVRFGEQVQTFIPTVADKAWYILVFTISQPTQRLEIEPTSPGFSNEWDITNSDPRKLGVLIDEIDIKPNCNTDIIFQPDSVPIQTPQKPD